jgi:acetyl esterase/lipase
MMSAKQLSSSTNSTEEELPPLPQPSLSLPTRISYFIQLWAMKISVSLGLSIASLLKLPIASYHPTFTKTFSCQPHLKNRVFIPKNHKAGELLPLYLDIHGGGFAICDPRIDDEFCTIFSNRFNLIIVSLNYSKAPSVAFPVPSYELAAIARAVIDDPSLPVDKSKVAIGGFSAGGNLALSASQLPELHGKIKAAVTWYPVFDWETKTADKLKRRPYKNPRDKDPLAWSGKLFNYGYINAGEDIRNPLLSVKNARREDLPPWIFTVAAEYDMLAIEARETMYKLAGIKNPTEGESYAFERGTYRWRLVRDVQHGFTHNQLEMGEKEKKRLADLDEICEEVGEWLLKGPFAS